MLLHWLITASLRNRLLAGSLALALFALGVRALMQLPVDAFPDTTPVQVQVNTSAPALSPEEVEQQITMPLEQAVSGLPGLVNVRSVSKFGLSQVVATFADGTSVHLARQLMAERIQSVALPGDIARPELGPMTTGLGEVFHYVVRSTSTNRTLAEIREWQDWVIKPQLLRVRGVAEVNTWGGFEKQFHVVAQPERLMRYQISFEDLFTALEANNHNVSGGQIVRNGEALLVRGIGLATNLAQVAGIVITSRSGVPVRVGDVADVEIGRQIRHGAVTWAGKGEVVLGLGFMLMGENSAEVTRALKEKLEEVRKALPPDLIVETLYDRTELVHKVIRTVEHNLFFGALLVIAVLFAFLGDLRAGLVVALAIPLSMLFAGSLMLQAGIAASLLSLGAIDFGLIVDGSVVMVENTMRSLALKQAELRRALTDSERRDTIQRACLDVARPVSYGVGIILVVFLPVLALEGVEGKLFKPMALTMCFALFGSLLFALTLTPALSSLILPRHVSEREPWLVLAARRVYAAVLGVVVRRRGLAIVGAAGVIAGAALLATRLGGEFLPKLGEQAIVGTTVRLAGVSVDEAAASNTRLEQLLLAEFPDEIGSVWTRLGSAEVATDPMGIELSDVFLALKPREQWTKARTQAELVAKLARRFADVPGMSAAFSQPIEMRMNELVAGIRSDVGIKIYGDDLEQLKALGQRVQSALSEINGTRDVSVEQLTGQPVLQVAVNPQAIARHGVPARSVLEMVELIGGRTVGVVREGQRHFPLVVRLPDRQRRDPEALAATLVPTAAGPLLPLGALANVTETEGPATITREWGKRRITVQCNVRGRDVGSFVAEARERIDRAVALPEGYTLEWGGQFENMQRANARLWVVGPLTLILILAFLYSSLGSLREVILVSTGIPLGAVGGVAALWARDMPFTVSAGVGFIALSGVAILNGLVLVTFIKQRLASGLSLEAAVREGCLVRLRPVLMTALVAAVGFVPMAINVGVGGEVQRPLATVVIGGVLSNTLLTLLVLPALCVAFGRRPLLDP